MVRVTVPSSFETFGYTGVAGAGAVIVFEMDGILPADDFTTVGAGLDLDPTRDQNADTFAMTEPLPPNDVPTSPGPTFTYDGGTVVYTNLPGATSPQPGAFMSGDRWFASYSFSETIEVPVPGNTLRRVKIAENNSPIPRNRYYFDYKFFRDVIGAIGDVNRFVFGFEKTFQQGHFSVDTRLPFGAALDSDQIEGISGLRSVEFGNVAIILKQVVYHDDRFLFAGGLGVTAPTGKSTQLFRTNGTRILVLDNNAVHLLPYVGSLWTPSERFYLQSFLQVDVDVNGNPVQGDYSGGVLPRAGVLQDATLLFVDGQAGYWLWRDPLDSRLFRGIAAITELHYNTTTQDADFVSVPGLIITGQTNRLDILNFTAGLHFEIGENLTIMAGMTFPLRDGVDRQLDNEVGVLANRYF
jgi:hypothetical protein